MFGHLPEMVTWLNPFFKWMPGAVAVQAFFVLSGFYMSMISTNKYSDLPVKYFYYSRLLKIFPVYYVVLIGSFLALLVVSQIGLDIYDYGYTAMTGYDYPILIANVIFQSFGYLDILGSLLLFVSHLTLIGQDILYGLVATPDGLITSGEWRNTEVLQALGRKLDDGSGAFIWQPRSDVPYMPLEYYLLIPQAWSLGLELIFYATVPFLMKIKTSKIIFVTIIALSVRVWALEATGLAGDGYFEYKFYPFEFCFFLSGMLAYRAHEFLQNKQYVFVQRYRYVGLALILILALTYGGLPDPKNWIFYCALVVILPLCFQFDPNVRTSDKSSLWDKFDRFAGDISYPLYICHVLVITLAYALFWEQIYAVGRIVGQSMIIFCSLGVSALLLWLIQDPIDRFRWQFSTAPKQSRSERRRKLRSQK